MAEIRNEVRAVYIGSKDPVVSGMRPVCAGSVFHFRPNVSGTNIQLPNKAVRSCPMYNQRTGFYLARLFEYGEGFEIGYAAGNFL